MTPRRPADHRTRILGLLLALLTLLSAATPAQADGGRWQLTDTNGERWGLALFHWPPDGTAASGWRLRLTARTPQPPLDHQQPLALRDGLGQRWQLPNRSDELVAAGAPQPADSVQFDLEALQPRPSAVLPLQVQLALVPGEKPTSATLTLPADLVAALSTLPPNDPPDPPGAAGG